MVTLLLFMLSLLTCWAWLNWKHRRLMSVANKTVGMFPKRFPILGHIPYTLFGLEKTTKWSLDWLIESLKRGNETFSLWIGPFPIICVCHVEDIQKLLTSSSTMEKGDEMSYMNYLGNGLLQCPGHIWKIKRRFINPLFHPNNLKHMIPTFNQNSEELVSNLSKHVGKGAFNVMDHVMDTAIKTVCHLISGLESNVDMTSEDFRGIKIVVERFTEIFASRIIKGWLRFDSIFEYLYKDEISLIKTRVKNFTEPLLKIAKERHKDKLEEISQSSIREEKCIAFSNGKDKGFLNLLDVYRDLQNNFPEFTEDDMKDDMVILYVTGSDTIGVTVSSCLLVLARHTEIQERVYEEIVSIIRPDGHVTLEDIQRLPYLDQVYKETIRWSIVVPFVLRKTNEDIKLSSMTIPTGYTVLVGIGIQNINPKNFPNPLTFDPENFCTKKVAKREKSTYLPFSGGPRNCIGQTYSNLFVKIILCHILRKYKLSTDMDIQNLRKKFAIAMVNTDGYNISVEYR